MVVIDASATGALILDDERCPPDSIAHLLATSPLAAPAHWPFEVANLILMAERRRRVTEANRRFLFAQVRAMRVSLDRDGERTVGEQGMALATRHRLTIYDAMYLDLSIRLGASLATLDRDLATAARDCGVPIVDWASS